MAATRRWPVVTYTPNLYACAVDYVGVSNLFTFLNTIPPYWKPYLDMMYAMVGDPQQDKTQLAATSPALNAERIKTPLFVAQGAHDPRVNIDESNQMVRRCAPAASTCRTWSRTTRGTVSATRKTSSTSTKRWIGFWRSTCVDASRFCSRSAT